MIGLLWFDDDPNRDLKQKVGDAARRYTEKFGRQPTVCYVHPSMLNGLGSSDNGTSAISLDLGGLHLQVVPRRSVLRNHFFIGEENEGHGSNRELPRPILDKSGSVLDASDSGAEWVQPALSILDDVPGRREAGRSNSV